MILLTGATGAAGSFIVNEFVRQREHVRVLVRDRKKAVALEKVPTVEIVEGGLEIANDSGGASVIANAAAVVRLDLPEGARP